MKTIKNITAIALYAFMATIGLSSFTNAPGYGIGDKVKDVNTMMEVMRYNDFKNDPLAEVDGCDEIRVPAGAIANRLDLSDVNAACTFSDIDWMVGSFSPYGALDAKVANIDSFPSLEFTAVAGPPHGNFPPFKWSNISKEYLEKTAVWCC